MIVSFIAVPGAGKTTHIKRIQSTYSNMNIEVLSIPNICHKHTEKYIEYLSNEDIEIINKNLNKSNECRDKGILSPIELDIVMFNLAVKLNSKDTIVILDGGPRGVRQAEIWIEVMKKNKIEGYKIVNAVFNEREEDFSKERQYLRIIKNNNLSPTEALKKMMKIDSKIDVYINDTKKALCLLKENGCEVLKYNANDEFTYNSKIIDEFIFDQKKEG